MNDTLIHEHLVDALKWWSDRGREGYAVDLSDPDPELDYLLSCRFVAQKSDPNLPDNYARFAITSDGRDQLSRLKARCKLWYVLSYIGLVSSSVVVQEIYRFVADRFNPAFSRVVSVSIGAAALFLFLHALSVASSALAKVSDCKDWKRALNFLIAVVLIFLFSFLTL